MCELFSHFSLRHPQAFAALNKSVLCGGEGVVPVPVLAQALERLGMRRADAERAAAWVPAGRGRPARRERDSVGRPHRRFPRAALRSA